MVIPALLKGGYKVLKQQIIGKRPGGRAHKVDLIAIDTEGRKIIISMKWQQVGGTAEQKVPFEIISLIDAMRTGNYLKAYLVLGGEGWSLRDFYIKHGLDKYITEINLVHIVSLENFVYLVNTGKL
ncbi:hypothetical protein JW887_03220 [Candidatus Dojkabacteria bacterium]|nr:hypothetical protein [Candidatus Dojkabacteria bacterium]